MKSRKNLFIGLGIAAAVLIVAIVGWLATRGPEAPQYITAPAVIGDVEHAVLATGTLQPFEVVNVGSQTSGQVTSMRITLGQTVKVGQLMATIDPTQLENQVRQAQSQLNSTRANLGQFAGRVSNEQGNMRRQQQLRDRGVGVPANYERAENDLKGALSNLANFEANVRTAELGVENAKNNLDRANIRAPISGVVAEISTPVGSTINNYQSAPTIARIAKMEKMTVRAQVSEADIIKIRPGQKVYFTILGDPNRRYYATLRATELTPANGVLDPGAKGAPKGAIYYNALFEVPNPEGILLPAMTAEVHVVLAEAKKVLTIPSAALGARGPDGLYTVRVLNADGGLEERRVAIGLNNNFTAEVKGTTLKPGDQVVVGEAGKATPAAAQSKPLFGAAASPAAQ